MPYTVCESERGHLCTVGYVVQLFPEIYVLWKYSPSKSRGFRGHALGKCFYDDSKRLQSGEERGLPIRRWWQPLGLILSAC